MIGSAPLRLPLKPFAWLDRGRSDDDVLAAVGIGADGSIAELRGSVTASRWHFFVEYSVRSVTITKGTSVRYIELEATPPMAYLAVQPLRSGGIVLATTRGGPGVANGITFDAEGRVQHAYELDDAIEHLLVDADDRMWVGYFDEGIFGGGPYAPNALCRFDIQGRLDRTFPVPRDDVYALNVSASEAWAYIYSGPDVVHIDERDHVSSWKPDVNGAAGLLVDGNGLVLVGTYDDPRAASYLRVSDSSIDEIRAVTVEMSEDVDIDPRSLRSLTCRGSSMYMRDGLDLFIASMTDLHD